MILEEYKPIKDNILSIKSKCFVRSQKDCVFPEKCAACTRENCCRLRPCAFAPEEFLDLTNKNYLLRLLKTRAIIIAPVGNHTLGIRARGKNDPPNIINNIILDYNPCALLTEHGCTLDYTFRPVEGLLVIPDEEMCLGLYEQEERENDWKAYQNYLKRLGARYGDKYLGYGPVTSEEIEEYKRLFLHL